MELSSKVKEVEDEIAFELEAWNRNPILKVGSLYSIRSFAVFEEIDFAPEIDAPIEIVRLGKGDSKKLYDYTKQELSSRRKAWYLWTDPHKPPETIVMFLGTRVLPSLHVPSVLFSFLFDDEKIRYWSDDMHRLEYQGTVSPEAAYSLMSNLFNPIEI